MHKFRTRAHTVTKIAAAAMAVVGTVVGVGVGLASAAGAIPTTTSLAASPSAISYGQSVTLTATVSTVGTTSPFSTGDTVTFTGPGSAFPKTVAISGTCIGSLAPCTFVYKTPTYTSGGLPVGTDTVTAAYSGTLGASSSGSTTVTVTQTAPGAPSLTVTAGSEENTLHWTAPASNGGAQITGYNVYRSTTQGGTFGETSLFVSGLPASATTYEDTAVVNTTYYYAVAATNSVGAGTHSNEASGTPSFPAGTIVTCPTGQTCSLDQVGTDSSGSSTNVQVTGAQTLSNALSSSGFSGCTTPISGLFSIFNDNSTTQDKTLTYTLYGSEATNANSQTTTNSPLCLGLGTEWSNASGKVPFNTTDGLYEGIVPTCSSPGQLFCATYSTGFVDHDGESPTGSSNENSNSGTKKGVFFWTATLTLPPGDGRVGP